MKPYKRVPLGVGSIVTYPAIGRCRRCGCFSKELYRVSKGRESVKTCHSCMNGVFKTKDKENDYAYYH